MSAGFFVTVSCKELSSARIDSGSAGLPPGEVDGGKRANDLGNRAAHKLVRADSTARSRDSITTFHHACSIELLLQQAQASRNQLVFD